MLAASLVKGGNRPGGRPLLDGALFSFSSRLEALHGLGLLAEPEANDLSTINNIRNEFAHRIHGVTFTTAKVISLCERLECIAEVKKIIVASGARKAFTFAFVVYWVRLDKLAEATAEPAVRPPVRWPALRLL